MKKVVSFVLSVVLLMTSMNVITVCANITDAMKYNVGDVIKFGSYKKTAITNENNETIGFREEPIDWRILKIEDGKALLLSSEIIDTGMYNSTSETVDGYYANNYAHSDIREWLTNYFYNTAFSNKEKGQIIETTLDNSACSTNVNAVGSYTDYSSESTTDKVFLLSKSEADTYASQYFETTATDYARANGFKPGQSTSPSNHWFLRTAGNNTYQIYYVQIRWGVYTTYFNWEDDALQDMKGIRPAIWLDVDGISAGGGTSGGSNSVEGTVMLQGYNEKEDRYGFRNFLDVVDKKIYRKIYGKEKGGLLYKEAETKDPFGLLRDPHGLCYGIATTTATILYGNPTVESFYDSNNSVYRSLSDINDSNKSEAKSEQIKQFTVEEYVKYSYATQFSTAAVNQFTSCEELYNAVYDYVVGGGLPVTISLKTIKTGNKLLGIGCLLLD